ncbi:Protein HGH1-like [Glycine soja]|uniref:Protein HGH1 homolog n=1 Tax=Glycine soja TaxID=3848 RepID=A0A445JM61_GLYSO|nr:Protein HGH1-like [Glycine soja]
MATEMEELVSFLSSTSPQITKAAVDIVRGLTGSMEGLQSLANYSNALLPALSRLLTLPKEVSEAAAEALVNLSQNSSLAEAMVGIGLVKTTMDVLYKPECSIARLLVMLLVNLTQLEAGAASLLQTEDEKVHGLYVMKLVRSFCRTSHESNDDAFEHVGSILVNISKQRKGRELLLDPKRGLLKQIIRQFDSNSSLRKKGVSGTIRNCCFEAENQLQNLLLVSEFLWPALLLPVASNKIYREQDRLKMPLELGTALSIEREPVNDPEIRIQALEAIYLIILQCLCGGDDNGDVISNNSYRDISDCRGDGGSGGSGGGHDNVVVAANGGDVGVVGGDGGGISCEGFKSLWGQLSPLCLKWICPYSGGDEGGISGGDGGVNSNDDDSAGDGVVVVANGCSVVVTMTMVVMVTVLAVAVVVATKGDQRFYLNLGVGNMYVTRFDQCNEAGRRAFWSVNGPRIVQIGYEDEEDPKVMEAYEQLGSLLVHSSSAEEPPSDTTK